jgi:hypothetical protein
MITSRVFVPTCLVASIGVAGCLFVPAPPPPNWNLHVVTEEAIQGLPPTTVGFRGINFTWVNDFVNATGDIFSFLEHTDRGGNYYCVNCRLPAQWEYQTTDGPCAYQKDNVDLGPGDTIHAICLITSFGTVRGSGYVVDYIPDQYWDWAETHGTVPSAGGSDTRTANSYLYPDQSVYSANGSYRVVYQQDGNLVLYQGGTAKWASGTAGTSPGFTVMQDDGNLVIYDGSGNPVWQSYTSGNSGAYMAVTNGGSVMILSTSTESVWWSGTGNFY